MGASSEESTSESASSAKKRKHDVSTSDVPQSNVSTFSRNNFVINGTVLDLTSRTEFGLEGCTALGEILASINDAHGRAAEDCEDNTIQKLIMSRVGIGPRGGVALAESLASNQTITHLDLERNGLGAVGGCAIFKALTTNNTIRKLNMNLNDLKAATRAGNDEATKAIGDALKTNSTLQEILLVRSGLGPKGGNYVAHGLLANESLLSLDLAGNDVMADGGQAIGEALKVNRTLKDLNLRWNRIGCGGDRGIESLADSLRLNSHLEKLDMSVNELYSEGAIAFGRALATNNSLLDLSLERNEIGTAGAVAIAEALKSNTSIKRLVLSGNTMIGDKGVVAIGQSLAENDNTALKILELVNCGVGADGAHALGLALKSSESSLSSLHLERNRIGAIGCAAMAAGLEENCSLQHLNISRNVLQVNGGKAMAAALRKNRTLQSLDISNNEIEYDNDDSRDGSFHIVASIVDHPALKCVNLSDNNLEIIPIDCQLKLARTYDSTRELDIDLSYNPLSSPPLGRKADIEGLKAYLTMLLSESTAVNRIRLMVLGFGGVGKSTFCDAVTQEKDNLPYFHGSLVPLENWDFKMISSWARRLGTHWAPFIASLLETSKISGNDLPKLISNEESKQNTVGSDVCYPSKILEDLMESYEAEGSQIRMNSSEMKSFARAIESLMRKGYFSTVGAVKLENIFALETIEGNDTSNDGTGRACSLVDFAGQMEYLVSHQLLLSSLHTLCVVLQPAPSFVDAESRHSGSWMYWSRFLRALGDRRRGSLLLAISQQDKVGYCANDLESDVNAAIEHELVAIRCKIPNITESPPLRLDYRPECIQDTVEDVRRALSKAADVVARDWWVPASYEKLAELVRRLEDEKKSSRELPILSREQLREELPSAGLHRMYEDSQLFQRGIEYLEAVGDVMADHRLDCLLLDPISWFASFLAHFIRDDDIVTSVQLESRFVDRGAVSLGDVVRALQHDYTKPREQVEQVMSLVCRLELCILYHNQQNKDENDSGNGNGANTGDPRETPSGSGIHNAIKEGREQCHVVEEDSKCFYLFPCLLPPATSNDIARHWPAVANAKTHHQSAASPATSPSPSPSSLFYRGYRLRSRNGFFPPGLFPGLLARCRLLRNGVMVPERMWKNCSVLRFGSRTNVMLRIDLREGDALLDIVGVAPAAEDLFVGAAKGQASIVIWMTHLVKMFLRASYPQLEIDECFLCPSAECHSLRGANTYHDAEKGDADDDANEEPFDLCRSYYRGTEFPAVPKSGKSYRGDHNCEADGCWSQLGVGHKVESMIPKTTEHGLFCSNCQREAHFELRSESQ